MPLAVYLLIQTFSATLLLLFRINSSRSAQSSKECQTMTCVRTTLSKSQHTFPCLSLLWSVISSRRGVLSGAGVLIKKKKSVWGGGICRTVWNNKPHSGCWRTVDVSFIGEVLCYGYIPKYVFHSTYYKCEDGLPCTICLRLSFTSLHQVDTDAPSLAAFSLKFSFNPWMLNTPGDYERRSYIL